MHSTAVSLRFAPGGSRVSLREMTGRDERQVAGISTEDALCLIEAVLLPSRDEGASLQAEDLVAADRDRILAQLYLRAFGDRIESTLRCEVCDNQFDIDFSLQKLVATVEQQPPNHDYTPVGANLFEAAGGWRFRIPTGRQERAVAALDRDEAERALFEACLTETGVRPEMTEVQTALDEVAPLLEFELRAACPECQQVHLVPFDIQTYLLRSLLNEQGRRISETHRLAAAYGWSLDEILSLTRTERRKMVELAENEISRGRTQ
jgi:hypothetical protein